MTDEYDRGYSTGMKDERFDWKLRVLQVGLTAAIMVGGFFYSSSGKEVGGGFTAERGSPNTPYLFDENEPHKYNPNPSVAPRE